MPCSEFTQLFNMLGDYGFVLDGQRILIANEYAAATLGYSNEELAGMSIETIIRRVDIDQYDWNALDIHESERPYFVELRSKSGRIYQALIKTHAGVWQGRSVDFVVCQGISRLVSANNRFETVFQDISMLMAISEIETGLYIDVNDTFTRKLGYRRDEVIGKKSTDLNILKNTQQRAKVLETFKAQGMVSNIEVQVRTKDGRSLDGLFSIDEIEVDGKRYLLTMMNDITEINAARRKVAESEENFRHLFNTIDDFLIVLDENGYIIYTNNATMEKLGYTHEQIQTMHVLDMHPPQYRQQAQEIVTAMADGLQTVCPMPLLDTAGNIIPVETRVWHGTWDGKRVLFGVSKDLSAQQAALDRFQSLFDSNPSPIIVCDSDTLVITQVNAACTEALNTDENELVGMFFGDLLSDDNPPAAGQLISQIKSSGKLEKQMHRRNGDSVFDALISAETISYMGKRSTFLVLTDITELNRNRRKIEFLSYHDALTGLYNRKYFDHILSHVDTPANLPVSTIVGDVNGLKLTNDVFGHAAGDCLLKSIADQFVRSCRKDDIVVRWGGDEFIVLLPKTDSKTAALILEDIKQACRNSKLDFGKDVIAPSISMGSAAKQAPGDSIQNAIKTAEAQMYNSKLLESSSIRNSIIESMKRTLYERSYETQAHANRLAELSLKIGRAMGLSGDDLIQLELISMLHDIGKIAISDKILLKPGPLTDDEWYEMKKHSEIGYRIAQATPEISRIAIYILSHHERWDGNGYPQNLSGDDIPLLSRIISVADAYDAMTNDRLYRKALSKETAIQEIEKCMGTQFDPDVAKTFISVIDS